MLRSHLDHPRDEREIAQCLARLSERAAGMRPNELAQTWRSVEPDVLACVRAWEREEGLPSGGLERLRNLTWEVSVSLDLETPHARALSRLAELFSDRAAPRAAPASS